MAISRSGDGYADDGAVNDICVNAVRTDNTRNTAYGNKSGAVSFNCDIGSCTTGYYGSTDTAGNTADKVVGKINGKIGIISRGDRIEINGIYRTSRDFEETFISLRLADASYDTSDLKTADLAVDRVAVDNCGGGAVGLCGKVTDYRSSVLIGNDGCALNGKVHYGTVVNSSENSAVKSVLVIGVGIDVQAVDGMAVAVKNTAEKSCGFICGGEELLNWNPLEICHLLHTTKDYYGTLKNLVPEYTEIDLRNFVKMSLGNLYHEVCHRYIHAPKEKNVADLPFTYRSVFFILQNLHYLNSGKFAATKKELCEALSGNDRLVLETSISLNNGAEFDFDEVFYLLFNWCKDTINKSA